MKLRLFDLLNLFGTTSLNINDMAKDRMKKGNVMSNCGRILAIAVLGFLTAKNSV